jgi:hypothetical protein
MSRATIMVERAARCTSFMRLTLCTTRSMPLARLELELEHVRTSKTSTHQQLVAIHDAIQSETQTKESKQQQLSSRYALISLDAMDEMRVGESASEID